MCDTECFEMIDSATSSYRLKLKSHAHHLGKTIAKQIGKTNKYFYNCLVTYSYLLSYSFSSVLLLLLLQSRNTYTF